VEPELAEHLERRLRYTETRPGNPPGFPEFPIISPGRYVDPRYYELEQTHVFRKSWMLAGHLDQLAEPGCFKTFDLAGEPVILFHGKDGRIRAFYNICRHRGATLTDKPSGKVRTLACAYHGWIYDNQGELVSIRDQRDFPGFDKSCYGLKSVRCEMMGGMIFINFDDSAADLQTSLGRLWTDFMGDYAMEMTNVVDHFEWDAPCNWKLLIEGGIENYHVRTIHRQSLPNYRDLQGIITLYEGGHSSDTLLQHVQKDEHGLVHEGFVRRHDAEAVLDEEPDNRPDNPRINPFSNEHGLIYTVCPNMQFGPFYAKGFTISCYWPTGLGTSRHEYYIIGYDRSGGPKSKYWERDIAQGVTILQEDLDYIEMVQKGIESRGNMGVKLGYLEARLYHFNEALDRQIGVEHIPPELRIEPVIGPEWIWPNDVAMYEKAMAEVETQAAE
jgi:phenylpropionate dioxygenase-like ring-hydroxylating dioxygenase large terminal subunit